MKLDVGSPVALFALCLVQSPIAKNSDSCGGNGMLLFLMRTANRSQGALVSERILTSVEVVMTEPHLLRNYRSVRIVDST